MRENNIDFDDVFIKSNVLNMFYKDIWSLWIWIKKKLFY